MRKKEFINCLAKKGYTKKDAAIITEDFLSVIEEQLVKGENILFHGFGCFEVKKLKPRKGKDFNNNDIIVPGYPTPKFTAGKNLKKAIRESCNG